MTCRSTRTLGGVRRRAAPGLQAQVTSNVRSMKVQLVLAAVLMTACAASGPVVFQLPPGNSESESIRFVDSRTPRQKISVAATDRQGPALLGDDLLQPNGPELLRRTLSRISGGVFSGRTIEVLKFSVALSQSGATYVDQSRLLQSSEGVPGGLSTAPLAGGLIALIESARGADTISVRIRGRLDGHEFGAYQNAWFSGKATEANIKKTVIAVVAAAAQDAERVACAK